MAGTRGVGVKAIGVRSGLERDERRQRPGQGLRDGRVHARAQRRGAEAGQHRQRGERTARPSAAATRVACSSGTRSNSHVVERQRRAERHQHAGSADGRASSARGPAVARRSTQAPRPPAASTVTPGKSASLPGRKRRAPQRVVQPSAGGEVVAPRGAVLRGIGERALEAEFAVDRQVLPQHRRQAAATPSATPSRPRRGRGARCDAPLGRRAPAGRSRPPRRRRRADRST